VDTDLAAYEEQAGTVGEFLEGLIEAFGLQGQVRVGEVDGEDVEIDIDGDDLGLLIGPHGQTMMALHELSKTVLQRTAPSGPRVRLRLDVAGYRQRRREALAQFVKAQAADVVATGQARALEPMNASDRKVVHDTINELDGVGTVSEGDEPRRRVVIVPE
jgi:spoIIIJ-associated protein